MNTKPKEGDLRAWVIVNPPDDPTTYPVESLLHGKQLIEALANSQLLDPTIRANMFGLEIYEDGEWVEWEGADGHSIDDMELTYQTGSPQLFAP